LLLFQTTSCNRFNDAMANFISGQVCNGQIWTLPLKATLALQCNVKKVFDASQKCPPLPTLASFISAPIAEDRDLMVSIQAVLAKGTETCQAQTSKISALTKIYICDIDGSIKLSVSNAKALTCKIQQFFQPGLTCPKFAVLPPASRQGISIEDATVRTKTKKLNRK